MLDKTTYIVAFLSPLSTLPQLYNIYALKTVAGVSPISWGCYTFFNCIWLCYGLVHREKVIIFNSSLWIIIDGLVTLGVLIH